MTAADRILDLMRERPDTMMTPAEIVVRLGVGQWTAYKSLSRMRSRGQVVRGQHGAYHLPGAKVAPKPDRRLLWSRLIELEARVAKIEEGMAP
jgi:DNA-binding IclR family transcriptional regulator